VAPDLALQVTPPTATPLPAGSPAAYSFVVSNNGPYDATGVALTISFPASTGVTASVSPSGAGTCTSRSTGATCTIDVIRAGFAATVSLSVTPTTEGAFAISASVQGDQPDSDTTNNSVSTSAHVALPTDLSVTVSGAASVQVGDAVSYTIDVSNAGPNTATSSQLTYQVAPGLTFTSVTPSTGSCAIDSTRSTVTCSLGDIAAGQSTSVTVHATAASAGSQVSIATVSTTRADTQSNNNTANATTVVTQLPPVAANDSATVQAGQSVAINVLNNDSDPHGTLNSASVRIVTQPTQGTVTVNSSGSVTYTANASAATSDSFTYTVDDTLGDRSSPAMVTVTVTAPAPASSGGSASSGSGGGSLSIYWLLALGAIVLIRSRIARSTLAVSG